MASLEDNATVPSAVLVSLIVAALRMINSSIGSLPTKDLRTVLSQMQHTNSVVSHSIRRAAANDPAAPGVIECLSSLKRLERDAREVEELSMFLETMTAAGKPILNFLAPNLIFSLLEFENLMVFEEDKEPFRGEGGSGTAPPAHGAPVILSATDLNISPSVPVPSTPIAAQSAVLSPARVYVPTAYAPTASVVSPSGSCV